MSVSSPSSSSTSRKKVTVKSSDGETFEVEERIALGSGMIKQLLEVNAEPKKTPVLNVTGRVLSLVISYLSRPANPTRPRCWRTGTRLLSKSMPQYCSSSYWEVIS
ncbi:hypothetical protein CDL15_Pgr020811 [Punica granatum]|nr:hypothetical protein CDL15_Pgr020811 [Punica granatum]